MKGFFAVSEGALQGIIDESGGAAELMAYLVLAKHTTGRGDNPHCQSTAGAKAIENRTPLTYRKAKARLEWLEEHGFISSHCNNQAQEQDADAIPWRKANLIRWDINIRATDDLIYLSHSLIDGLARGKNNPPLQRLWNEVQIGCCHSVAKARLDALTLLLHGYKHHSISDFGGIDPTILRKNWQETGHYFDFIDGWDSQVKPIQASAIQASPSFIGEVFINIEPDENKQEDRFWNAFHNLKRLGFIYDVIEVWSGDPLVDEEAEILYPLYIQDARARETDPYAMKATHSFLHESGLISGGDFKLLLEMAKGTNQFLLIKTAGDNDCAIGSYRMRFRPATSENAEGFESERELVERWESELARAAEEINSSCQNTEYSQ